MPQEDEQWMRRALELAERGRGHVEPNPLVGAVLVRDGAVVGEGWHEKFGQAHAEINALETAKDKARDATLYLTLEPCCHQGKTPPCTDAVLRAGVKRVVAAMTDPFPAVQGKGIGQLAIAGVVVDTGLCETEARRLNAPYLKLLSTGLPYVHAKWAMTLDGKIATRSGASKWISGEESRRRVHELRGRMDAIIVGHGTVLADDPSLTARPPGPRTAVRVVLDSQARTSPDSQLVKTAHNVPTLVATTPAAPAARVDALRSAGCEVLVLTESKDRVSVTGLLQELGRRRFTNVLVEGGGETLGSFLDAGAIDEVHAFIAPQLVGGAAARTPIAGLGVADLSLALRLARCEVETLGQDVLIHGWLS